MSDLALIVISLVIGSIVIGGAARLLEKRRQARTTEEQGDEMVVPAEKGSRLAAAAKIKKGADWFFWIAGLSVLNSIISLLGGGINFLIGLGLPQIMTGVAKLVAGEASATTGIIVQAIAFAASVAISAIFVGFGLFARNRQRWAFIVGMILYVLDGLVFIWVADYWSIGFHVLALLGLFGGLRAVGELAKMEHTEVVEEEAGLDESAG